MTYKYEDLDEHERAVFRAGAASIYRNMADSARGLWWDLGDVNNLYQSEHYLFMASAI